MQIYSLCSFDSFLRTSDGNGIAFHRLVPVFVGSRAVSGGSIISAFGVHPNISFQLSACMYFVLCPYVMNRMLKYDWLLSTQVKLTLVTQFSDRLHNLKSF